MPLKISALSRTSALLLDGDARIERVPAMFQAPKLLLLPVSALMYALQLPADVPAYRLNPPEYAYTVGHLPVRDDQTIRQGQRMLLDQHFPV